MKKIILIADDEPENRDLLEMALAPLSMQIVAAKDGKEAISLAEKYHPDLAILDILMPGGHGFSVCQELRRRPEHAAMKIIFLSSKAYETDRQQALRLGANGYYTKPFDMTELRQAVIALLGTGDENQ